MIEGNQPTNQPKMNQMKYEYDFECVCGYLCRKSTKKALDLMKRLHATKCEQFNNEDQTYAYDTLTPIDKYGNKKMIVIDYGASNEKQDKKIVKLMNKLK